MQFYIWALIQLVIGGKHYMDFNSHDVKDVGSDLCLRRSSCLWGATNARALDSSFGHRLDFKWTPRCILSSDNI